MIRICGEETTPQEEELVHGLILEVPEKSKLLADNEIKEDEFIPLLNENGFNQFFLFDYLRLRQRLGARHFGDAMSFLNRYHFDLPSRINLSPGEFLMLKDYFHDPEVRKSIRENYGALLAEPKIWLKFLEEYKKNEDKGGLPTRVILALGSQYWSKALRENKEFQEELKRLYPNPSAGVATSIIKIPWPKDDASAPKPAPLSDDPSVYKPLIKNDPSMIYRLLEDVQNSLSFHLWRVKEGIPLQELFNGSRLMNNRFILEDLEQGIGAGRNEEAVLKDLARTAPLPLAFLLSRPEDQKYWPLLREEIAKHPAVLKTALESPEIFRKWVNQVTEFPARYRDIDTLVQTTKRENMGVKSLVA